MIISYKKLWKLLIDMDLKKTALSNRASVSYSTVAKFNKGENMNTAMIVRICTTLQCDISDIMDMIPEDRD